MIIQHNIPATNAYRNLISNRSCLSKNLEKLSAGYRINRAADDAAGLAISEAMRSKINGLEQATANANDAIGLIQTEEGALTETHSMLQRMTTLATQAANDTYNSTARESIQKELYALADEIDRIANNTDYNGIKPLAADSNKASSSTINNSEPLNMTIQIGPTKGEVLDLKGRDMTLKGIFETLDTIRQTGMNFTPTSMFPSDENAKKELKNLIANKKVDLIEAGRYLTATAKDAARREYLQLPDSFSITVDTNGSVSIIGPGSYMESDSVTIALWDAYQELDGVARSFDKSYVETPWFYPIVSTGKDYIDLSSKVDAPSESAGRVIRNIQSAIDYVSSYRAELGAKQNRLEHTINNLQVTSENTIAAESRIRDTDMAKEMAAYTKNNILSQAAQSMLAQANQTGQGVLSLLQ